LDPASFSQKTADISPDYRANAAFDSIDPCSKKNLTAAGYMEDRTGFNAIGNSKGLFGYNKATSVEFLYNSTYCRRFRFRLCHS
jgi:hypothetical protein